MKKLFFISTIIILLITPSLVGADGPGYDEFGYNLNARIFNGTGYSYCLSKVWSELYCLEQIAPYKPNDKLVIKWNAEWARGRDVYPPFSQPPYINAWMTNQWNGNVPGGSGRVWYSKIVWVGDCLADPSLVPSNGSCKFGNSAVIMDHGIAAIINHGNDLENKGRHLWWIHAISSGNGPIR